jgi:hypothetical protein
VDPAAAAGGEDRAQRHTGPQGHRWANHGKEAPSLLTTATREFAAPFHASAVRRPCAQLGLGRCSRRAGAQNTPLRAPADGQWQSACPINRRQPDCVCGAGDAVGEEPAERGQGVRVHRAAARPGGGRPARGRPRAGDAHRCGRRLRILRSLSALGSRHLLSAQPTKAASSSNLGTAVLEQSVPWRSFGPPCTWSPGISAVASCAGIPSEKHCQATDAQRDVAA